MSELRGVFGRALAGSLLVGMACCCVPAKSQENAGQAALTLEQQGKPVEAEAAWKQISESQPGDPLPFAHLGLLEARAEHYAEAIAYYRKAMALSPNLPGLHLNLGLAYFKDGQYKLAIQTFTPLLKRGAQNAEETQRLNVLIGMSYYGLGEYPLAVPYLKGASASDADNLPLLLSLAHSCLLSKQYDCVLDAFHRMVALNAESAEADMLVGEALDEMKDPTGATREFRAAIKANPKEPNAHFGLGYLLWTQGETEEAALQFQAELENDPEHTQAILYLADSYIQMSRLEDARPLLEKLVKTSPKNSMGRMDLGIVYSEEDRNAEALSEFRTAIALKPDNVTAHYRLGRLYRKMGKMAEAKAEFEISRSLHQAVDDKLLTVMSGIPHQGAVPHAAATAPANK